MWTVMVVLLMALGLLAARCNAETMKIYTWKDKSGVQHISDRPPGPDDSASDVRAHDEQFTPKGPEDNEQEKQSLDRMMQDYIEKPAQERAQREQAEREAREAAQKAASQQNRTELTGDAKVQMDAIVNNPNLSEDKKLKLEEALWLRLRALEAYKEQQKQKKQKKQME